MNGNNRAAFSTYLLFIISVVLGIALLAAFGFYHFEFGHNDNVKHFSDSLWWTMVTMTTIGYGDIYPVTPGGRLVAVFLMFVGIGTLGVSTAAIAAYFVKNDQFQLLRIRNMRDHVIICGLGNKGLLLARAFRERGSNVIIIEENESNSLIETAREQGSIVLIGDGTEPEMLTRARLQAARYLIAVCGDDGTNAEVATHARDLVGNRKDISLTCSAHIVDPELWYLLRNWEISTDGSLRMQFFNVYDLGARALLAAHAPFNGKSSGQHLLIVGTDKLAQNIVLQASHLWREHGTNNEKFKVTLVGPDTSTVRESLYLRHPQLDQVCDVETYSMEVPSPQFQQATFLFDAEKRLTVTAVYICLDNDGRGLSAGLSLLHRMRHRHIPIVVQMTRDAGLATLLHTTKNGNHGFERLRAVGLLERICQPDLVLGGANEALARAMHERYLRDQKHVGTAHGHNPSLVNWDHLPEELKESNRRQADDIGKKLQSIGCDIAPLTDWDASTFDFSSSEIDHMAQMEHERWVTEREAQGWKLGPRDPVNKTNPNLLPWETLPEESKVMNREAIRELPISLIQAGFQIYRINAARA